SGYNPFSIHRRSGASGAPAIGFSFGIREFDVLLRFGTPDKWLRGRGEVSSWVVHGEEIENKPDRVKRFESRFCPAVSDYCNKKTQPKPAPFKISPEPRTYFPECRNEQRNENKQANQPQSQIGFQIAIMSFVWDKKEKSFQLLRSFSQPKAFKPRSQNRIDINCQKVCPEEGSPRQGGASAQRLGKTS